MKILVADDEAINRKLLELEVKELGYKVLTAKDGYEAKQIWENERPSIVLTDWNMPNMNGIDLVKHIRNNEGNDYTYIIMVTAMAREDDLIVGFEAGVDDYLTKPVGKHELYWRLKAGLRLISNNDKDMLIFALAKLTEIRDEDTGNHIERIRLYSKLIAEELYKRGERPLEINQKFIDDIYITSVLHDIGKEGIPDNVLFKPDKLNSEEYNIIKNHTLIGYKTIESLISKSQRKTTLSMAGEIARSHHENWDGSGYPDGLNGEDIPLSARIVALADFYDALVSKRVYKESWTHDDVVKEIFRQSGKKLDPYVVSGFLSIESEFQKISSALDE